MEPDATKVWPLPQPYDFFETTRMLRTGHRDPTLRREPDGLWRAANTPEGPATVRLTVREQLHAKAWGPGAVQALKEVPQWIGLDEAPWELPPNRVTDRLLKQHPGLRGTNTLDVFESLVNFTLQQLVTWNEAAMTWRLLCEALGAKAPGPTDMRLPPTPQAIRAAGMERLLSIRLDSQRARTLVEIARVAHRMNRTQALPTAEAAALLQKIRGVGPWTASNVLGMRMARPEPVPLGDYNLRHTVAWALAGEPRATEARMLELLKPFEGFGYRVVRLIFAANIQAPRRGPRRGWRP